MCVAAFWYAKNGALCMNDCVEIVAMMCHCCAATHLWMLALCVGLWSTRKMAKWHILWPANQAGWNLGELPYIGNWQIDCSRWALHCMNTYCTIDRCVVCGAPDLCSVILSFECLSCILYVALLCKWSWSHIGKYMDDSIFLLVQVSVWMWATSTLLCLFLIVSTCTMRPSPPHTWS